MKIPINQQQSKKLILGLVEGKLYLSIVPEIEKLFPETISWFNFWNEIYESNGEEIISPFVELDRLNKIAILIAIREGVINTVDIKTLIDKEEKRERFLELMMSAGKSADEKDK